MGIQGIQGQTTISSQNAGRSNASLHAIRRLAGRPSADGADGADGEGVTNMIRGWGAVPSTLVVSWRPDRSEEWRGRETAPQQEYALCFLSDLRGSALK